MNHRLAEEVGHVFTAVGRDTPPLVQRPWTKRWGGRAKRTESLPTRHGENCLYGIKLGEADRGVGGINPNCMMPNSSQKGPC